MVTHVFDNSSLSQEIFAIDTWGAVICSLGRKHILTILPTIWRQGFTLNIRSILALNYEIRLLKLNSSKHIKVYSFLFKINDL